MEVDQNILMETNRQSIPANITCHRVLIFGDLKIVGRDTTLAITETSLVFRITCLWEKKLLVQITMKVTQVWSRRRKHIVWGQKLPTLKIVLNFLILDFLFSQPEAERKSLEPGPGKYETMDQFGTKYMNSKSKNLARTSFFGNERFYKEKKTPGPGDYTINTIEPDGRYVLSNMRGSGRRAIM